MKSPFSNNKPRDWVLLQRLVLFYKEISVSCFWAVWCSCKCLWGVWEADEGGVPLGPPLASTAGMAFMSPPAKAGPQAD